MMESNFKLNRTFQETSLQCNLLIIILITISLKKNVSYNYCIISRLIHKQSMIQYVNYVEKIIADYYN